LVGLGAVILLVVLATGVGRDAGTPPPAVGDEILVLVGQFANYSGGQVGYNVAGRLQEALQTEVKALQLTNARVATWPEVIVDREAAVAAGQALSATLVIWGEYDSGRVVTSVVAPAATVQDERDLTQLISSPGELNLTINTALPQEMRWMGLYALGEALYGRGRYDQARPVMERALADAPTDSGATAGIYFALGVMEGSQPVPDLSQAIAYYTLASDQVPGFVSALNNRGVAYLNRGAEGDRQRAIDDLRRVTELSPDSASGHFNLGMALLGLGEPGRTEALASLRQAQSLAPDAPGPNNALCWTYGLLDQAQEALSYCDRAVAVDPSGLSRDSRGLVLAMLGRYEEAIAEFEGFLAWLDTQPEAEQARYRSSRTAWNAALEAGQNPYDEQTRARLLEE
jgi:tetratricopeptide (TPR) repeat protein